jgi:hypothetical protein
MRFRVLSVAIVLIGGLVLGMFCLTRPTCPCRIENAYREITTRKHPDAQKRTFREIMAANGVTPDGHNVDNNVYLSSDCVLVQVNIQGTSSLASSEEVVRRKLNSAYRILDQKPALVRDGKTVEGRAIALFGSAGKQSAVIKWDEAGVLSMESSSLEHALELERDRTN